MKQKYKVNETSMARVNACSRENEHQVGDSTMSKRNDDCSSKVNVAETNINWTSEVLPIVGKLCRKMGLSSEVIGVSLEYLAKFPGDLHELNEGIIAEMRPTWSPLKIYSVFEEFMHCPFMNSLDNTQIYVVDYLHDSFLMPFEFEGEYNEETSIKLLETLPKYDRDAILSIYSCWLCEVCLDGNGYWRCDPFELDAETIEVLLKRLELNRTHVLCDAITMYGQALSTEKSCVRPVMGFVDFLRYASA